MIGVIIFILAIGGILLYALTHKNRWYLDRHAGRLGIKPKRFETDKHLRERILEKLRK